VAQLPSLRSLNVWAEPGLQPSSWSALRSLSQLTSLRVMGVFHQKEETKDGHLQHIAAAAPQLQQLHYITQSSLGPQAVSCIASLTSLASLHLELRAEGSAHLARPLAALTGLTHLDLRLYGPNPEALPQLMQALGQLTGLASLSVDGYAHHGNSLPLAPLEALQQLTHLSLGRGVVHLADFAVLDRLGALRALEAQFVGPAAAAAAWLHRLQSHCAGAHGAGGSRAHCSRQAGRGLLPQVAGREWSALV
jgi:hypothetical protein